MNWDLFPAALPELCVDASAHCSCIHLMSLMLLKKLVNNLLLKKKFDIQSLSNKYQTDYSNVKLKDCLTCKWFSKCVTWELRDWKMTACVAFVFQATKQFLEEINKWTSQHGVSPLSWDVAVKFLMARKFDVLRAIELFHSYRVCVIVSVLCVCVRNHWWVSCMYNTDYLK